jgi:predicted Zn-dependent protease with MMP-like domain
MKAKTRVILEMAIERGIERGYRRAFKHTDSPAEATILESIEDTVMFEIHQYFTFGEDEE